MFGAILKATNSSFQKGMTFYRSLYVKKVMKLLAFIFEQPSYQLEPHSGKGPVLSVATMLHNLYYFCLSEIPKFYTYTNQKKNSVDTDQIAPCGQTV